jgi:hypothetical protein
MPELLSIEVAIFLCGTFAAAFMTSLSGFTFAMVAAAIWLYALPPPQASALIAAYALIVQGYAVWKLRGLLDPHRLCHSSWAARWEFLRALRLYAGLHRFISGSGWACCWSFSASTIWLGRNCRR